MISFPVVLMMKLNHFSRMSYLCKGHSVRMCFIVSGLSSPQSSQFGGCSLNLTYSVYVWVYYDPILDFVRHLSHCRFSRTVLGNIYIYIVLVKKPLVLKKKSALHKLEFWWFVYELKSLPGKMMNFKSTCRIWSWPPAKIMNLKCTYIFWSSLQLN